MEQEIEARPLTGEEIARAAASLAEEMERATEGVEERLGTALDRNQREARAIGKELWERFIALRRELIRRGVHDPILGRFDSATVVQAGTAAIAEQVRRVAAETR
ncbi:MAG TPA: hypothetical protein VMT00_09190 [Thermoanaerobaculia bacterium]|nr:hypothetical protein [Thermoanaerobaculia bacterium]